MRRQKCSYLCAYEASLNSGNTLKWGSATRTGILDLGQSSNRKKYPSQGRMADLKALSRNAVHKSSAEPIASSVLLLKLFPKEGPTCDFNSTAKTNWPLSTTKMSHSLCRTKIAWQLESLFPKNTLFIKAGVQDQVFYELRKAIHLRSASDCRSKPLVLLARRTLLFCLSRPRLPIVRDRTRQTLDNVPQNSHRRIIAISSDRVINSLRVLNHIFKFSFCAGRIVTIFHIAMLTHCYAVWTVS